MENIGDKLINKSNIFLFYILLLEIVLGGSGKLFNFPIRILILGMILIFSCIKILRYKIKLSKKLLMGIGILWTYCFLWGLWGLFQGNGVKNVVSDITNFFCIVYAIILIVITENKKTYVIRLIKILKISMIILSIITIILFVGSFIGNYFDINIGNEIQRFNAKTNYGIITGGIYSMKFARVYFVNGIYMQIALPFFVYDILNKNRVKDYIYTLIILLGIFSSSTRGYWLGAATVIAVMLAIIKKDKKKRLIKILICVMIASIPIMGTNFFKTEVIERVASITDFSKDVSNDIRRIQIRHMNDKISEKPLLGSGFGANLVEYTNETGLSGRTFEVYYLELIYKTGLVGGIILGGLLISFIYKIIKNRIISHNYDEESKEYIIAMFSGTISVLVTGVTNPYMQGSIGMFIIACMIYFYFALENKGRI